jgi:hypothetical protein
MSMLLGALLFIFFCFGHQYGASFLDWGTGLGRNMCSLHLRVIGLGGRCENHEEMWKRRCWRGTTKTMHLNMQKMGTDPGQV